MGVKAVKSVKIGIIVVALAAAAAIFFLFGGGEEALPPDEGPESSWMCADCGHVFDLTLSQSTAALEKVNGAPPIECQKCKAMKAYGYIVCGVCQTKFFGPEVPGSTGVCTKCKPDAEVPPEEEEAADEPPVPLR